MRATVSRGYKVCIGQAGCAFVGSGGFPCKLTKPYTISKQNLLLLWAGSARWNFRPSIGPMPWTAAWEQKPMKATCRANPQATPETLAVCVCEACQDAQQGLSPTTGEVTVKDHCRPS